MNIKDKYKFLIILIVFLTAYYFPFESAGISGPVFEALMLLQEYAREHVVLCLVPAFFIAGAVAVFTSQQSVIKYFGAKANKFLSYSAASVSGTILAVCSSTVLPLFAGIYTRGAGIGPATAFLYQYSISTSYGKGSWNTGGNSKGCGSSCFCGCYLKTVLYFTVMVAVLVFANRGADEQNRIWQAVYDIKWYITAFFLIVLGLMLNK